MTFKKGIESSNFSYNRMIRPLDGRERYHRFENPMCSLKFNEKGKSSAPPQPKLQPNKIPTSLSRYKMYIKSGNCENKKVKRTLLATIFEFKYRTLYILMIFMEKKR